MLSGVNYIIGEESILELPAGDISENFLFETSSENRHAVTGDALEPKRQRAVQQCVCSTSGLFYFP